MWRAVTIKKIKENENEYSENDTNSLHNKAFECLETDMKCPEWQKNADPIQITYLRIIRDIAAMKKIVLFEVSDNKKL